MPSHSRWSNMYGNAENSLKLEIRLMESVPWVWSLKFFGFMFKYFAIKRRLNFRLSVDNQGVRSSCCAMNIQFILKKLFLILYIMQNKSKSESKKQPRRAFISFFQSWKANPLGFYGPNRKNGLLFSWNFYRAYKLDSL